MGSFSEENKKNFLEEFNGKYDMDNGSIYDPNSTIYVKDNYLEYLQMSASIALEAPFYNKLKIKSDDINTVDDIFAHFPIHSTKENYSPKKYLPPRFNKYKHLIKKSSSSGTTGPKEILLYTPLGEKKGQTFFEMTRSFFAYQLYQNEITSKNFKKNSEINQEETLTWTGWASPTMMINDCSGLIDNGFAYIPILVESRGVKTVIGEHLSKITPDMKPEEMQNIFKEIYSTPPNESF